LETIFDLIQALEAKANEFAMMLAEQQKKMLTQFQVQYMGSIRYLLGTT
jgi:hypothetical protein